MSREDISTVLVCLACDGTAERREEQPVGRYSVVSCCWCTQGGMDRDQVLAWTRHQREEREKKARGIP